MREKDTKPDTVGLAEVSSDFDKNSNSIEINPRQLDSAKCEPTLIISVLTGCTDLIPLIALLFGRRLHLVIPH